MNHISSPQYQSLGRATERLQKRKGDMSTAIETELSNALGRAEADGTPQRGSVKRLAGKVGVVTGGSTGMGLATAARFRQEGMDHVFITGRRKDCAGRRGRSNWREGDGNSGRRRQPE
jgi:hypothetical protein